MLYDRRIIPFMVYGHSRIPIVSWLRGQGSLSMTHAHEAGELITTHGGHPSLKVGALLSSCGKSMDGMLREILEHERFGISLYQKLLSQVEGHNLALEEYARHIFHDEAKDTSGKRVKSLVDR